MQQQQQQQQQQQIADNTVFTIVVGGSKFYVSWKSIISDGPANFFTRHFTKTRARLIHLDRSSDTFKVIVRHLQGYPIVSKDEYQHQDLLNDAYFYGLKRLVKLLKHFVYVKVGDTTFRLKWDLFNKDGPYNYFTGPLKNDFLSPHAADVGQSPPISIQRNPDTFREMIRHLQGYHIHVRDEVHRQQLLSDAQFYLFRRLRDRLTTTTLQNPDSEIVLHTRDIRASNLRFEQTNVCYLHEKKLFSLVTQLNSTNVHYHSCIDLFTLDNGDIKLPKDPQWRISNEIVPEKDCAVLIQEKEGEDTELRLDAFLNCLKMECKDVCTIHPNCWISWFGLEKALCKVALIADNTLQLSVVKMQVVRSRVQANMKRGFLAAV